MPSSTAGLGSSASRGAAFTMGGQALRIGLQFVGIVVLARLLDPADYGLLAMVTAITGIGELVRDFGLSYAAIQAKQLSRGLRDNLFWLNTAIGVGLTAVTLLAAPLIAAIYSEPRLIAITAALSFTFTVNGMSTQYRASMARSLHMGKIAIVDVAAPAVGLVVGIVLAATGSGYWALVWQQLVVVIVSLALLVTFAGWAPRWFTRGAGTRKLISFGSSVFLSQAMTYVSRNIDSVVIGSQLGASQLGIYNRAFQLLLLPLNQINAPATRVAVPVLSRLQDAREKFGEFLLTGQTVILHLILACFSLAVALADPLVYWVLGDQWGEVIPIFQILAIAGVFQVASGASYWVFIAKGLTRPLAVWSITTRPFIIVAVIVGAQWGLIGVALAFSISTALMWPLGLIWISRVSDAPAMRMLTNGLRAMVLYTAASGAAFAAYYFTIDSVGDIVAVLLGVGAWLVLLAVVALVWPGARRDYRSIVEVVRLIRRRKS